MLKKSNRREVNQMARRSIWKGAITFGMVAIPSKLYSATEDVDISLHQYHKDCGSRISMPKYCGTCDCYDAKCPPCLKIPCFFPDFYKCPPPKCCGRPPAKSAVTK